MTMSISDKALPRRKTRLWKVRIVVLVIVCLVANTFQKDVRGLFMETIRPLIVADSVEDKARVSRTKATEDSRPLYVFHVGPPKSGTTTLQAGLTAASDLLAMDNYTYTGAFYSPENGAWMGWPLPVHLKVSNVTCFKEISALYQARKESDIATNQTKQELLLSHPCVDDMIQHLVSYNTNGSTNLIHSDETIGFYRMPGLAGGPFNIFYWETLQDILNMAGYRLLVVVTYRRVNDWLLSSKRHLDKWTPSKPGMNKWPQSGGTRIKPFFPNVLSLPPPGNKKRYFMFYHTLDIVNGFHEHLNQSHEIKILNFHMTNQSVLTTLLCDVLPNAKKACTQNRQNDASTADSDRLVLNTEHTSVYDQLSVRAADLGLFNISNTKRHDVTVLIQDFHEGTLGLKSKDFPQICPSTSELEAYLNVSLNVENILLPTFAESVEMGKQVHRANFWKNALVEKKFCDIDTDKVLANETYKKLFQNLGTRTNHVRKL